MIHNIGSSPTLTPTLPIIEDELLNKKIAELANSTLFRFIPGIHLEPLIKKVTYNYLSNKDIDLDSSISLLLKLFFNSPSGKFSVEDKALLKAHFDQLLPILIPKGKDDPDLFLIKHFYKKTTNALFNFLISTFENKFKDLFDLYQTESKDDSTDLASDNILNFFKNNTEYCIAPAIKNYFDENSPYKDTFYSRINSLANRSDLEPLITRSASRILFKARDTAHADCLSQIDNLKPKIDPQGDEFCKALRTFSKNSIKDYLKTCKIGLVDWIGETEGFDCFIEDYIEAHAMHVYINFKKVLDDIKDNEKPHEFLYEFTKEAIEKGKIHLSKERLPEIDPKWTNKLAEDLIQLLNIKLITPPCPDIFIPSELSETLMATYFKETAFPALLDLLVQQIMDPSTIANGLVALSQQSDVVYDDALRLEYEEKLNDFIKYINELKLPDEFTIDDFQELIEELEDHKKDLSATLEEGTPRYKTTNEQIAHIERVQDRLYSFIAQLKKNKPITDQQKFIDDVNLLKSTLIKTEIKFSDSDSFNNECFTIVNDFIKKINNPIINHALQIKQIKRMGAKTVGTAIKNFLAQNTLSDLFDLGIKKTTPILKAKKIDPVKLLFEATQAFKQEYKNKWHWIIDNLARDIISAPWRLFKRFIETFIRLTFGFETSLDKTMTWIDWIGDIILQFFRLTLGSLFYLFVDLYLYSRANVVLDSFTNEKHEHKKWVTTEIQDIFERINETTPKRA